MRNVLMKRQPVPRWTRFAMAGLFAAVLAGCGGSDGAPGATGATGAKGDTGNTGDPGVDATVKVNLASISADAWANLNLKTNSQVNSVAINSAPPDATSGTVVNFQVKDAYGNPVNGLTTSQLSFAIAKLVPGSNGSQSKWVNYLVWSDSTSTPTRPTTEKNGTLASTGDGTYKYTFANDITGPLQKKIVDYFGTDTSKTYTDSSRTPATTYTYTKTDVLGSDYKLLDYDPALPHRVVVQLSGSVNGGTLKNPVNLVYNFVPNSGKISDANRTRQIVSIDTCNTCHEKLAFHGGGRVDTDYCVVCHTDQRKNGYVNVASTSGAFPALTETATTSAKTGITSYSYAPSTNVADGEVSGNFTTLVHKIHQGGDLLKQNYNYANIAFNNKGFSMLDGGQRMCSACHDNTKAAQADNWNTQPSRLACGSCHDGVNWSTGTGLTPHQASTAQFNLTTDDSKCSVCHTASSIKISHQTQNVTKHNPTIATGLATFTYEIKSAKVETNNDVTIEFAIKKNGTALTVADLPLTGFTYGPSFLLAYATTQDGVASPVDFNNTGIKQAQASSISLEKLVNGTLGSVVASSTTGYLKATIDKTKAAAQTTPVPVFPATGATMRTVALQGYFTQNAGTDGITAATPRHAISVVKTVTGDTARRTVVDPAKCSNCHEWFEGHGGNRVYETQVCVMCHTPGLATSGRGIADSVLSIFSFSTAQQKILTDWGFDKTATNAALKFPVTSNNFKDMIHGIHAGRDRVTPFADARDSTSRGAIDLISMKRMDFPGILNSCTSCHKTGTYSAVPAAALLSTYESIDLAYATAITNGNATPAIAKTALSTANDTDSVTTPFAASCVSCHDSTSTQAHVRQNGGLIKATRSAAIAARGNESCATCHGTGSAYDIAVVHQ